MSIIPSTLGILAVALTLAMPAVAEHPRVVFLTLDESDAARVIAKFKEKTQGWPRHSTSPPDTSCFPLSPRAGLGSAAHEVRDTSISTVA